MYKDGVFLAQTTLQSYIVSGIKVGQSTVISVSAVNEVGEGAKGTVQINLTLSPSAPISPLMTVLNNEQVLVDWATPVSDGGSAITGYEVLVKNKKLVSTDFYQIPCLFTSKLETDCRISVSALFDQPYALEWGDTFCAVVVSLNSMGKSDRSQLAINTETGEECARLTTVPDRPENVRADASQTNWY